jgi:hypothetical protein
LIPNTKLKITNAQSSQGDQSPKIPVKEKSSTSFLYSNSPMKEISKKGSLNSVHSNTTGIFSLGLQNAKECKKYSLQGNNLNFDDSMTLNNLNLNTSNVGIFGQSENLIDNKLTKLNLSSNNQLPSRGFTLNYTGEIIDCEIMEISDLKEKESFLIYDTFCEAFFISGLPSQDAKVILDSNSLKSTCGHKDCSILYSYRPEVLYKYQKKRTEENLFDISNSMTSLCFPTGIKMCHSSDKNSSLPPMQTFMNIITNEKGEIFYLVNFFYYKLVNYSNFQKNYNYDPVREYLKEITAKEGQSNIEKELNICSNLMLGHYKYIPECISLVSRFPYVKQLEKSLETIFKLMVNSNNSTNIINFYKPSSGSTNSKNLITVSGNNLNSSISMSVYNSSGSSQSLSNSNLVKNPQEEILNLLSHLINEVPIPPMNKKLMFYIPYNLIEIPGVYMKELPTLNYGLKVLLDEIPIENLILIFQLLILEQKILLVCDDYSKLSEISQALLAIIYPFQWINTYIPVLSEDMIKYLQSFIPFVMGIDEGLLKLAYNCQYIGCDELNKIFIVNLSKKTLSVTSLGKKEKKITKKNITKEIPEMPCEVFDLLTSEFKFLTKILDDPKNKNRLNMDKVDNTIREIFVKVMVMLFGDFKKYAKLADDGFVVFNYDVFVINRPKAYKKFYQELVQTQIFKEFLQKDSLREGNFNNSNNLIPGLSNNSSLINHNYFQNMCLRHISLINPSSRKSKSEKRSSSVSQNNLINNTKEEGSPINSSRGHRESRNSSVTKKSYINSEKENSSCKETQSNSFIATNHGNIPKPTSSSKSNLIPNLITQIKQITNHNDNKSAAGDLNNSRSGLNSHFNLSLSLTNENTASNTKDCADCFLIAPYFVNDPISKFDQVKIESILTQKFPNNIDEEKLKKRILASTSENPIPPIFTEEKNKNLIRKYFIKDMFLNENTNKDASAASGGSYSNSNISSSNNSIHNQVREFNLSSLNNQSSKSRPRAMSYNDYQDEDITNTVRYNYVPPKKGTSDKISETIKNALNESLSIVFSGKDQSLLQNQHDLCKKILALRQGRNYLSGLLLNNLNKESKYHNLFHLPLKNFNDLTKLLYTFLVFGDDSPSEYKEIRIITKATFYYYKKNEKGQVFYIYEELLKKSINIWNSENFWSFWFQKEIDEEKDNNVFPNIEDFYFTILLRLGSYMSQLGLKAQRVSQIIIQNLAPSYLNKSKDSSILIKELEESLERQSQL